MAARKDLLLKTFKRLTAPSAARLADRLIDACGAAPPFSAAQENAICAQIEKLAQAGGDLNVKTVRDNTPLSLLVDAGCLKAAECLLKNGAAVDACTTDGTTPLLRATNNANAAMMRLLLKHGAKMRAVSNENRDAEKIVFGMPAGPAAGECLKALVEHGLPLDIRDEMHIYQSKIHLAVAVPEVQGALDLKLAVNDRDNARIRALLEAGVKPDVNVKYGDNAALIYAGTSNNVEGMELLINAGANVNLVSPMVRKTPLLNAATHGKKEACKILVDHGADPYIEFQPKGVGGNAFVFAGISKTPGMVEYLREIVADYEWRIANPPPPDITLAESVTVTKPLQLKRGGP